MEKFKTLTELEILNAACSHYLDIWAKLKAHALEHQNKNEYINKQVQKYWEKVEELSDTIIELENKEQTPDDKEEIDSLDENDINYIGYYG